MAISLIVLLFICMTTSIMPGIRADHGSDELGKGVFLPKINLLDDFEEDESSVFASLPPDCFKKKPIQRIIKAFEYYNSSKAFFSKIATGAGLEASLQSTYTLGVTLNSLAQKKHSEESIVSGLSLDIQSLTSKIIVRKDCLMQENATLTKKFTKDLEALPLTIRKPWLPKSWETYNVFLRKYGSHVITSVSRGVALKQTSFAQSSKSYSERELEVKSCVSLAGPTQVGKVGVEVCANVSKSEISNAKNMSTQNEVIIRGGSIKTASALKDKSLRTERLINKFLKQARRRDKSVKYTFKSLWRILLSRFEAGTPNFIRAVNMQYYFLGYLNYGCDYEESGGVVLRKFDYTKRSTEKSPEFTCTLAAEGCRSDNDCHYKVGVTCSCYGSSCVRFKDEKEVTGVKKRIAYIDRDKGGGWNSCGWKERWLVCACHNESKEKRIVVWRLPINDVVQQGSGQGENQDQSGDAEEDDDRDAQL